MALGGGGISVAQADETASSDTVAPHDQVTRLFRVCNTGNNADTFSISRFDLTAPATLSALYFDNDAKVHAPHNAMQLADLVGLG